MSLEVAYKSFAEIFHMIGTNETGREIMRCLRCEGLEDKKQGRGFVLLSFVTTKAKEHIGVYCPGLNPIVDRLETNLRHTLLVSLPKGVISTINKVGLVLRKIDYVCMIDCFSFFFSLRQILFAFIVGILFFTVYICI
jgi:hypothetical protein